jgi:hypothetical protein
MFIGAPRENRGGFTIAQRNFASAERNQDGMKIAGKIDIHGMSSKGVFMPSRTLAGFGLD